MWIGTINCGGIIGGGGEGTDVAVNLLGFTLGFCVTTAVTVLLVNCVPCLVGGNYLLLLGKLCKFPNWV